MESISIPDRAVTDALAVLFAHFQMPPKDDYCSSKLQPELMDQEEWLESAITIFTDRVKDRIATIRRQRNRLSPIHRLPTEIIASIFEMLVGDRSTNIMSYSIATELAKVSSQWRDIAFSTPRLWTKLDNGYSQSVVEAMIARSQNAPLKVFIGEKGLRDGDEEEVIFVQSILPHLHRLETLACYSGTAYEVLSSHLENKSMPFLRHFRVSLDGMDGVPFPCAVSHNAPHIQSLHAIDFSFPLRSPALSSLRSISFEPTIGTRPFSSDDWHSFLSSSPQLEDILVLGKGRESQSLESAVPFEVHLPRLQTLTICQFSHTTTGFILSSISCNRHTLPSLHINDPWEDDYHPENAFEMIFSKSVSKSSLRTCLQMITSICVDCSEDEIVLEIEGWTNTQRKLLRYDTSEGVKSVSGLYKTLLSPNLVPKLTEIILIGSPLFNRGSFSSLIPLCIALERLTISLTDRMDSTQNLQGICEQLSLHGPPISSPDGNVCYERPCPNLKFLGVVIKGANLTHVTKMIKARYGAGVFSRRMVPLEELRLSSSQYMISILRIINEDWIDQITQVLRPYGTALRIVDIGDFDTEERSVECWTRDRRSHLQVFSRE